MVDYKRGKLFAEHSMSITVQTLTCTQVTPGHNWYEALIVNSFVFPLQSK
jgi:hypothetical protein